MRIARVFAVVVAACALAQMASSDEGLIDPKSVYYRIGDARVPFLRQEEPPVVISSTCGPGRGPLRCDAWTHYKKLKITLAEIDAKGANNPAAALCRSEKGMKVVARDDDGNEFVFCAFADGSILSAGSMYAKAVRNSRDRH